MEDTLSKHSFLFKEGLSRPKKLGWILSVSFAILSLGALLSIALFGSFERRRLAFNAFKAHIINQNFSAANSNLKKAVAKPMLTESIILSIYPKSATSLLNYDRELLSRLFEVNSSIRRREWNRASRILTSEGDYIARKANDQTRNATIQIGRGIASYKEVEKDLFKANRKIGASDNKLRELRQRFGLIAQDLADIFSLTAVQAKADKELPVYSLGILKDLPQIEGIPDSVADLSELNHHVTSASGQVQRGIRTADDLIHSISRLKDPTNEIVILIDRQQEISTSLSVEKNEVQAALEGIRKELLVVSDNTLTNHQFGNKSQLSLISEKLGLS